MSVKSMETLVCIQEDNVREIHPKPKKKWGWQAKPIEEATCERTLIKRASCLANISEGITHPMTRKSSRKSSIDGRPLMKRTGSVEANEMVHVNRRVSRDMNDVDARTAGIIQTLCKMGRSPPKRRSSSNLNPGFPFQTPLASAIQKRKSDLHRQSSKLNLTPHPQSGFTRNLSNESLLSNTSLAHRQSKPLVVGWAVGGRKHSIVEMLPQEIVATSRVLSLMMNTQSTVTAADRVAMNHMRRHKIRLDRRQALLERFRKRAKFLILLTRLWKYHAKRLHDIFYSFDTIDAVTEADDNKADLMFDVTDFRVNKEQFCLKGRISQETKRILKLKSRERTDIDIYHVEVALRNFQGLSEMPMGMRALIAKRGWYETYAPKRIIVHENDVPMCFYFILSGSVAVSVVDKVNHLHKTDRYLNRGDLFGDDAITNGTRHQSTVISKEKVELLCLRNTDYVDIFLSRGLHETVNDKLLQSAWFLQKWDLQQLLDNQQKARFCFFRRGTVLVRDSQDNDWIYIIKSGSCDMLLRLQKPEPKEHDIKMPTDKKGVVQISTERLSHEDKVVKNLEMHESMVAKRSKWLRQTDLPEINIETTDSFKQIKTLESLRKSVSKYQRHGERQDTISSLKDSIRIPNQSFSSGPFLLHPKWQVNAGETSADDADSGVESLSPRSDTTLATNVRKTNKQTKHNRKKFLDDSGSMYVTVNTLTKGSAFGLHELVCRNQPQFSLVSNGAECVMINKKFYLDNGPDGLMQMLEQQMYPYPTEDEFQKSLETKLSWEHHKRVTMKDFFEAVRVQKTESSHHHVNR